MDPRSVVAKSRGRVVECVHSPRSLCFTSAESNWSNNPVMFPKVWFRRRMRPEDMKDNRLFEFHTMLDWLTWHPPARICASFDGMSSAKCLAFPSSPALSRRCAVWRAVSGGRAGYAGATR